ncbi:class I SAM-dependent methyltransferase [Rugosimonospora africana]|uniref:16S RNA G1207 methylase RsmC n=1 Tax=Rugosimonospora africana TaxID=556532 RepID=A0A8J3QLS7_9ACTN|nr:methyltransferase [Rugosimonospora africana]GIH12199.1 16S RNA G1207 methylase RsmC [Rugosimonospora africana]
MTGDHHFSADPNAQAAGQTVTFEAGGREFTLAASSRAVSAQRLDPGAAVLLRKAPLPGPRGGVYLDLGCGYGAITAVLAASSPAVRVYAVDVDPRALELVARNAAALGLSDRIIPATPDRVPDEVVFDEIWSDPPIRIGKAELHEMLLRWLPRLARHGTAWLVVDRHLGGDSLQAWLSSQGYQVERCASQKGYRVLSVAHAE